MILFLSVSHGNLAKWKKINNINCIHIMYIDIKILELFCPSNWVLRLLPRLQERKKKLLLLLLTLWLSGVLALILLLLYFCSVMWTMYDLNYWNWNDSAIRFQHYHRLEISVEQDCCLIFTIYEYIICEGILQLLTLSLKGGEAQRGGEIMTVCLKALETIIVLARSAGKWWTRGG